MIGRGNRWIMNQGVDVVADQPWIGILDEYPPFAPTIEPEETNFYTIAFDPSGLPTAVYEGAVTWSSLDSGTPSFELTGVVRLDVGRQISGGVYSPPLSILLNDLNPVEDVPLTWSGPTTPITDADVAIALTVTPVTKGQPVRVKLSVVSPNGTEVALDNVLTTGGLSLIYDDDTAPPDDPAGLAAMNGETPDGTWLLRIERLAIFDVVVDVSRFEVRLHVD